MIDVKLFAIRRNCGRLLTTLLLLLGMVSVCWGGTTVGTIVSLSGNVDILRNGELPAEAATPGASLAVGDFLRTKSNAQAEIRFHDGNVLKVAQRSRIAIGEYASERESRTIGLARGKVEAVVVPPAERKDMSRQKRFEIHTPNAVAGVRGTDLVVFYDVNATGILVKSVDEGDDVYGFSHFHPEDPVNVPQGWITYIRDRNLPLPPRPAGASELNLFERGLSYRGQQPGSDPPDGNDTGGDPQLPPDFYLDPGTIEPPLPPIISEFEPDTLPETDLLTPSVLVGTETLTGEIVETVSVSMEAQFFASSSGGTPSLWRTSNISGFGYGSLAGTTLTLIGQTISADMTFSLWNQQSIGGTWAAFISGTGNINGFFNFSGNVSGTFSDLSNFIGSGGGSVTPGIGPQAAIFPPFGGPLPPPPPIGR